MTGSAHYTAACVTRGKRVIWRLMTHLLEQGPIMHLGVTDGGEDERLNQRKESV